MALALPVNGWKHTQKGTVNNLPGARLTGPTLRNTLCAAKVGRTRNMSRKSTNRINPSVPRWASDHSPTASRKRAEGSRARVATH